MKKIISVSLMMLSFLVISCIVTAWADDTKKIEAKIGWRTMDQKNLVLVKDGEIVMKLELNSDVSVKVKDKDGNFKAGKLDDVLSSYEATVTYQIEGDKNIAKEINVTPVKAEEEE